MPILIDSPHSRHERIAIPTIWVALALSLLLHAAVLWGWLAKIPMLPFEDFKLGKPGGALAVRLAPPPSEPPGAALFNAAHDEGVKFNRQCSGYPGADHVRVW